jgi:hypothetical protein
MHSGHHLAHPHVHTAEHSAGPVAILCRAIQLDAHAMVEYALAEDVVTLFPPLTQAVEQPTHGASLRARTIVLLGFRSESHRHKNFACQRAPGCAVDRNLRCTPAAHTMADIGCPPPVLHIGSTRHAKSLDGRSWCAYTAA